MSIPEAASSAPFHPVLRDHNAPYEAVARAAGVMQRSRDPEAVLRHVDAAARLASEFHAGRFADGGIENAAWEIGAELDRPGLGARVVDAMAPVPKSVPDGRRRVLHVATQVHPVGGHTRIIRHWARNDRTSSHTLVLTEQGVAPIPDWLHETFRVAGGGVVVLPWRSPIRARAMWLREAARRSADLVVLHHHPFDVVPTVALATPDCPTVAILNHADHIFWLGSSVADTVINLRGVSNLLNEPRRFLSRNVLLPVPLPPIDRSVTRSEARAALGIPGEQTVLLTVGRAEKYRPCGPYSFFAMAAQVLARNREAHLYVVGVAEAEGAMAKACDAVRGRLHLVGNVEDPSPYWAAADVYLESFPFGSQTALLEAGASGLPVVPAFDPMFPLLVANDDAVADILPNPATEDEYVRRVEALIRRPADRETLGAELRARLLVDHAREGWLGCLAGVYKETASLTHSPRRLPVTSCDESDLDIGLGLWHALRDRGAIGNDDPWAELRGWLFGHACAAKHSREFRTAFRIHSSGIRLCGLNRRTAAAVAKLMPQWALRTNF